MTRDGIGVVAAGTYDADSTNIANLFGSMYTDIKPASALAVTEVPYVAEFPLAVPIFYAARWLQKGTPVLPNPYVRHANPNVYHRIAAATTRLVQDQITHRSGAELGVTSVSGGTNYTFILTQRIEDLTTAHLADPHVPGVFVGAEYFGLIEFRVHTETTAHETVHLWVHAGGIDGLGHCVQERWQHDALHLNCLMHTPYAGPGLGDGLVDLHYENHGADSEYMTIRRAADPVPQQ